MSKTLYQKYLAEIEATFDWPAILHDLEMATEDPEMIEDVDGDGGRIEVRTFIGTVFNLTPSGKYYMPWACSNVTRREAYRDEQWERALFTAAERRNCYPAPGDGDPCDIFISKIYPGKGEEQ